MFTVRNQAKNKKTFQRRPTESLNDFQNRQIVPSNEFMDDPAVYCQELTPKGKRVLKYLVDFGSNHKEMHFSHAHISKKCDVSISHLKRLLLGFRRDGLIQSRYRHLTSCLYRLSSAFFSQRVRNALSSFLPVLACLFMVSQLFSKPPVVKNGLQSQENIIIRSLFRNEIKMRAGETLKSSQKSDEISELSPEDVLWFRSSSKNELEYVKYVRTNKVAKDPFVEEYREKAFEKAKILYEKRGKEFKSLKRENRESSNKLYVPLGPKPRWEDFVTELPPLPLDFEDRRKMRFRHIKVRQQDEVYYRKALKVSGYPPPKADEDLSAYSNRR